MARLDVESLERLRSSPLSEYGNRLDLAIRMSRMTQRHIAKRVGLTPQAISMLKTGKQRRLSLDHATRLAEYFGCESTDLFPPDHIVRELTVPDLARPVERARSPRAGTKRARRAMRKQPELVFPLPPHLEKQRLAIFEMLTDARLAQRLTLQEVADRLNRTRQQVEQWESSVRSVRIDTLLEWAEVLGYRVCLEPLADGPMARRLEVNDSSHAEAAT